MKRDSSKNFQIQANQYAKRSIESMRDDLAALEHARECREDGCKRGHETRRFKKSDGTWGRQELHENPDAWHDEENARRTIDESPLDIAADKGERFDGTRHYMILLGTGGPAARIVGELDQHAQPETATFQYQDWFKPWTDAWVSAEDADTLLEFAQQFYFAEVERD